MSSDLAAEALYDRDDARRLLDTELQDPAYQRPFTGPLREAVEDLFTWLGERAFSIGGFEVPYGPLLVLAVVVAAAVITVLVVRPRLQRSAATESAVVIDPQISAAQLRSRAAGHVAAGDFNSAAQDAFRALVRSAEESGALPAQEGRTATEIANTLSTSYAAHARELHLAAETFNRSAYGSALLSEPDYRSVSQLDQRIQASTQEPATAANGPDAAVRQ